MQLKNALLNSKNSNRGVSPVIGVILMVVITVILAGVVAVSFMGFGDQVDEGAPQASFDDDYDSQTLTLTHQNGDEIDASNLKLFVDGSEAKTFSGDISAGSQLTYDKGSKWNGESVRLVYDDGQGNTATLYSNDGSPQYLSVTTYDTTTEFQSVKGSMSSDTTLTGDEIFLDGDGSGAGRYTTTDGFAASKIEVEVASTTGDVQVTTFDSAGNFVGSDTTSSAGTMTVSSGTDIAKISIAAGDGSADGTATISSFTVSE